jgi:PfaB family protein
MIRRLETLTDLVFVGMSVVVPSGGGIDEFGRLVYRGLPISGSFRETLEAAILQTLRQVCEQARLAVGRVPVIGLSPSVVRTLQMGSTSPRVQEATQVSSALAAASDWLESGGEEVVALVEAQEGLHVVSALLVAEGQFAQDNARSIYARVAGATCVDGPWNAATACSALQEARRPTGVKPEWIGLMEAATLMGGTPSAEEADALLAAFGSLQPLTCALGAGQAGLLGVVQTAWCLSRRVIPGVTGWAGSLPTEAWQNSPFYVPSESRTWFIPENQNQRYAGLNLLAADGSFTHFLLCDVACPAPHAVEAPRHEALHLFPLAARSAEDLLNRVTALESILSAGASLEAAAEDTYREYLSEKSVAEYAACLLGQTPEELMREIGFALKGIPDAMEKGSEWQTPLGSTFTPRPQGKGGKVSFVYPGAFNTYPGAGRDIFYLYPNLYEALSAFTGDPGGLLNERLLYPRSLAALNAEGLRAIEDQLTLDPITMLLSGSCLSVLYTDVLRAIFEIHPASAFGYSLGEISMLFASRVWTEADRMSQTLRASPLFRTRIAGPQNAVREYWNLPAQNESDRHETLWVNYLLMSGPEKVREVLPDESRVYLTHINTPRQVVIGGDPAGCQRIIDRLKCKSIRAPFNYALHCEPIRSEYSRLEALHSVPVRGEPGMTLYSAATYQPMPMDQRSIAQHLADELCSCLDFPRLIRRAYADGARIFIELGAGSNCARWVDDTLQDQPHAAYAINRKGADEHTSILRLLARMISHLVPLNLNVLYEV